MTWDRRILRIVDSVSSSGYYYNVHEVTYDDDRKIIAWTANPVYPGGETVAILCSEVGAFLQAWARPILEEQEDTIVEIGYEDSTDNARA